MFKTLPIFILTTICFTVSAQEEIKDTAMNTVNIEADFRIEELNQRFADKNKNKKIDGYRIQIFSGSRTEADDVRKQFMRAYPEMRPVKKWDYPNFKVQIGNFVNELDAQKMLPQIKQVFNGALVVNSKIDLPDFSTLNN